MSVERERRGWKAWWRRLETAPAVRRIKRRVRQWLGTEIRSRVEVRCRVEAHGGWWLCPAGLPAGGRAYCFGIGEDLELERVLATRFAMRVFAFDPTPWTVAWMAGQELPDGLDYRPLGLAAYDGRAFFHEPGRRTSSHSMIVREGQTGRGAEVEVRRLPTLLRELGHDGIDLLKLDIEGAEYEVIEDLRSADVRPDQLLVEFHHRFAAIGNQKTEAALRSLGELGYRIFHISPSGREYGFLRGADPSVRPGGASGAGS